MTKIRDHSAPFRLVDARPPYSPRKARLINGKRYWTPPIARPRRATVGEFLDRKMPVAHALILLIAIVAIVWGLSGWMPS